MAKKLGRAGGLARKAQIKKALAEAKASGVMLKDVLGNVGGRPVSPERAAQAAAVLAAIDKVVHDDCRLELIDLFKRVAPSAIYFSAWRDSWGEKMDVKAHHAAFRGFGAAYRLRAMERVKAIVQEDRRMRRAALR